MSLGTVTSDISGYSAIMGADSSSQVTKEEDPLGRDAFLTMLVTQLKHQDPLNPMQGSDFSAQLAQFSSLEQLFNVNDTLEAIQTGLDGNGDENLLDFIGKNVLSWSNNLSLEDGESVGGNYSLKQDTATVINIYDGDGFQVAQLTPGVQPEGTYAVNWDGKDALGEQLADGTYTYEVLAVNANGIYSTVDTGLSGEITGVTFEQGSPYLLMGDQLVSPSSVIKVSKVSQEETG
jgi:flagellar basal-body rod modification protein FlgD